MLIDKIGGNSNFAGGKLEPANAEKAAQNAKDSDFEKLLKSAVEERDDKKLKEACRQFEGFMIEMMYKQVKATIIKSDLMAQDPGTEIFSSMLDEKLAEISSHSGGFGLAEVLYKQLSGHYGMRNADAPETGIKSGIDADPWRTGETGDGE
jgi:flagellar protein FlgJ